VAFIEQESGQHFDPVLVDFPLENLTEIIYIKDKYAEPEIGQ
jgi:response regulator RpfG family c-di-GMP phosphodiesterase